MVRRFDIRRRPAILPPSVLSALLFLIFLFVCSAALARAPYLIERVEADLAADNSFTPEERERYAGELRQALGDYAFDILRGERARGADALMAVLTEGAFEGVPVKRTVEAASAAYLAVRRGADPEAVEDIALYGFGKNVSPEKIRAWAGGYQDCVERGVPVHIAGDLVYRAVEHDWNVRTFTTFKQALMRAAGRGYDMEYFQAHMLGSFLSGKESPSRTAYRSLRYFRKITREGVPPELPEYRASFIPQRESEAGERAVDEKGAGVLTRLTRAYRSFLGAPYVRGGQSRRGTDCSGFVMAVFSEVDVDLPRSSREQWKAGERVREGDLRKGDLVFFRTRGRRISHVGIVHDPAEGVFIHASSSKGVTFSDLDSGYYKKRYAGARRVIGEEVAEREIPNQMEAAAGR